MPSDSQTRNIWSVIFASSAGTLIEWYDFYIFGSLAVVLSTQFFPKGNPTVALLSTLATFATGFIVRPFGALVFGRMGDTLGRKHTFIVTMLMMGASTCAIGLLPNYETIGVFAPIALVALRLVQGLALGGEYGGAATYVAEHAPDGRRGYFTSFIQTTATLGLFVSLLVILFTRSSLGEADFSTWGWRIPFLASAVLVVFSYAVRRRMDESPLFTKIREEGAISKNPLRESFAQPENRRLVMIALFGATAGQGVIWYTGQFYALYFLQTTMNVDNAIASKIVAVGLLCATPFFVVFGSLSDRIGRKKLMMSACLIAAVAYVPIYGAMKAQAPTVEHMGTPTVAIESSLVPATKTYKSTKTETFASDGATAIRKTELDSKGNPKVGEKPKVQITPSSSAFWALAALVFLQTLFVTMIYGPIAAFLVELFPTRIRYTSMSVPYHIGNGVVGGLVPFIGTAAVAAFKNPYAGVYYPIAIAAITFVVGSIFIRESAVGGGFAEVAGSG